MTKRNLVFLDFDGVLNSIRSVTAYQTAGHNKVAWDAEGLDEVAVRLVRRLCEEAPAEVVISSAWRKFYPLEQLTKFLEAKGWPNPPIIGQTVSLDLSTMYGKSWGFRGNEVGHFLAKFVEKGNELGNWVVLDDSKDFHYEETSLGGFFSKQPIVNTDDMVGFSFVNFYDALKILNPEHELLQQLEYYYQK